MGWKSYLLGPEPECEGTGALWVSHALLAPHSVLLSAEGMVLSSLSGRPGTDVHWNLKSGVWPFLSRDVKQDWNQARERSHRYSAQAETALPFVPAIVVRKGLLVVGQTHNKQTSSFNELRNPSLGNQWCELTFHSLSPEAMSLCHKKPVSDLEERERTLLLLKAQCFAAWFYWSLSQHWASTTTSGLSKAWAGLRNCDVWLQSLQAGYAIW